MAREKDYTDSVPLALTMKRRRAAEICLAAVTLDGSALGYAPEALRIAVVRRR
jgi:imidazole glycerol phosphate synthase subunit HisF